MCRSFIDTYAEVKDTSVISCATCAHLKGAECDAEEQYESDHDVDWEEIG